MRRPHCLLGGIVLSVIVSSNGLAQSRSATLVVSAVVVRSCSVQAHSGPSRTDATPVVVSLTCSGRTANSARLEEGSVSGPSKRTIGQQGNQSRVVFRVVKAPGDTLVTLQF